MIHIKETEIIPLLKEAQTEYSQKITEGDPKDVEMAERIEEALTQAMDIVYDYQSMADEHKRMVEKYETEAPVIKRGMDFYCCPACGKRTSRNHTHCHWCGKKLGGGKAQSWAMGIQSLGEHLTLNIGECPKEESVSTLSQILEETPHRKYYLSVKACLGILRRAEKRGKQLPEILRQALIRQAQLMSSAMTSATGAE